MRKDEQHPGRGINVVREATAAEDAPPVVPTTAGEDDPRTWGDVEGNHDEWLREQRPPHWG